MRFVGVYVRTIRAGRGISQVQAAHEINVSPSTIGRFESGETDLPATALFYLIDYLRASLLDVDRLIRDPGATAQDAERLAFELLARSS